FIAKIQGKVPRLFGPALWNSRNKWPSQSGQRREPRGLTPMIHVPRQPKQRLHMLDVRYITREPGFGGRLLFREPHLVRGHQRAEVFGDAEAHRVVLRTEHRGRIAPGVSVTHPDRLPQELRWFPAVAGPDMGVDEGIGVSEHLEIRA